MADYWYDMPPDATHKIAHRTVSALKMSCSNATASCHYHDANDGGGGLVPFDDGGPSVIISAIAADAYTDHYSRFQFDN